ncbi:MAG TPA: LytTR family DNA-binding domain-containing protein [Terriglobales bacterium]|nr:LytTR family DNA-binding domain-containing protein [Terriglobales bacterium]
MSLSTLIVDDEQLARDELAFLLKSVDDLEVVAQGRNGVEAVSLIKEHSPDLVFLDVQMPGLDGFGVIKKLIDKKVRLPQFVFATAYDQYAVKAFEVNAVDYLLKPFDKKRVAESVQRARKKLQASGAPSDRLDALLKMLEGKEEDKKKTPAKILLKSAGRLFLLDQKDISFSSIEDGVITVVTPAMEGQSNCRTLEELLDSLDPNLFWRAHRSYLVNINRIREVVPWFKSSYMLRMDDKKQTEIPVSRAQTKRLRELFRL